MNGQILEEKPIKINKKNKIKVPGKQECKMMFCFPGTLML